MKVEVLTDTIGKFFDVVKLVLSGEERKKRYEVRARVLNKRALDEAEKYVFTTEKIEGYMEVKKGLKKEDLRQLKRLMRLRSHHKKRFFELS